MAATSLPGGNLPAHRSLEERVGAIALMVGGHLHDYGEWVRLEDVESGEGWIAGRGERDEEGFDGPFTFEIRRDPKGPVAVGGPGPNDCLGANLSRREMSIMFEELFKRVPDMEVCGEPEYLMSYFINGIKKLPVKWTPR